MAYWFESIRKRYKIRRELPQFWDFPELGFGYIQIPKVATRSIRDGLMKAQGMSAGIDDFAAFEQRFSSHIGHSDIRRAGAGKVIFAFVRHPLARLYSAYVDKIVNAEREGRRNIFACHDLFYGMNFEHFVERVCEIDDRNIDRHLRSQAWFLTDTQGLIPNFLGRLESFNIDWERLRQQIPSIGKVDHLNLAAGDSDYLAQYSPHALSLVHWPHDDSRAISSISATHPSKCRHTLHPGPPTLCSGIS